MAGCAGFFNDLIANCTATWLVVLIHSVGNVNGSPVLGSMGTSCVPESFHPGAIFTGNWPTKSYSPPKNRLCIVEVNTFVDNLKLKVEPKTLAAHEAA